MNLWRLNLSALSHVHNLFFLASRNTIRIYEPEFPDQAIREPPAFIIKPPSSAPDLGGGIFSHEPHSINHLIVDFRGNEEILLIACDDGDAIAWRTDDIQNAVDRAAFCTQLSPRPIFLENVGASAWGLAIHKEARLIAVSCNKHVVTVFAPALISKDPDLIDVDAVDDEDRWADRRIELPPSSHNIPSLAFCNTGEDPEGRWLLIGDIHGVLNLANVWAERLVERHECRFCAMGNTSGFASTGIECLCHLVDGEDGGNRTNIPHGIWGVAFLDKRSFKKTVCMNETLGMECTPNDQIYDVSKSREYVRNSKLVWNPKATGPYHEPPVDGPTMWTWHQQPVFQQVQGPENQWGMPFEPNVVPMLRSFKREMLRRLPRKRSQYHAPLPHNQHAPPTSPILQIACRDLFLSHTIHSHSALRPTIAFHDPLFQTIDTHNPSPLNSTPGTGNPTIDMSSHVLAKQAAQVDRMSLHAQIPELGVFLAGSPKGRVGVFSLTQMWDVGESSHNWRRDRHSRNSNPLFRNNRNNNNGRGGGGTGEPIYGFRIDHVLPTAEQEVRQRPRSQLVGVAVGPVQGLLGESRAGMGARRRWRVVLTWADGSVLCYELGKKAETVGGGGGMGLEGMMV
ncbi:hypothetical protein K490DRAFT_67343 [Saccharata proteae CBS 121410]|uniref:Uncharacterized protein n=1 Tax=Saccharata proteae CBS 121410 TaxID=1314787 RepID=A0A9P4HUB0_9PEZI|nr:hypothetical protein K490DRAFT_67343 [Saccharata proteae CBS 121410]